MQYKPITIAYLYDGKDLGGIETVLVNLFRLMDRRRFRPLLLSAEPERANAFFSTVRELGVEIVSSDRSNPSGLSRLGRALQFRRALQRSRVRLLHVNSCLSSGHNLILGIALSLQIPVIRTVHWPVEEGRRYSRTWSRGPFDFSAIFESTVRRVITVSEVDQREQIELIGRAPAICVTIPNGIELRRFDAPPPREVVLHELGFEPTDLIIGAVGRLEQQKGLSTLIEATPRVLAAYPNARVLIAGEGPDREALLAQARACGVGDRVVLMGHRTDVPRLFAAFDVFAFPSLFESHPMVLLEALAAGAAVVASDIPSVRSAIDDSAAALFFPTGDARALADSLSSVLGDPGRAAGLRCAARERARRFPVEGQIERTQALYDEVLAEVQSGSAT